MYNFHYIKKRQTLITMWNSNIVKSIESILIFNLVLHPLKDRKIKYENTIFKINNVFKEWNNGWYISLEIEEINNSEKYQKYFLKIPFKNINCENQEILERIKISQQKITVLY